VQTQRDRWDHSAKSLIACILRSGDQYQNHLIQDVRWLLVYDIQERPQLEPLLCDPVRWWTYLNKNRSRHFRPTNALLKGRILRLSHYDWGILYVSPTSALTVCTSQSEPPPRNQFVILTILDKFDRVQKEAGNYRIIAANLWLTSASKLPIGRLTTLILN
jgi:hypothetical protein